MTDDRVLILDGGLSTALESAGHRVDGPLWTGSLLLDAPDVVTAAHRTFVDAGADLLITGSYQLSFDGGRRAGWGDDDVERALRNSTIAARLAASEDTLVAASIGPYGAHLNDGSEFHGRYGVSDDVIRRFHDRRLDILLDTQPDLLAIETMPSLDEVRIILELVHDKNPDIPLWVSFTVREPGITAGGDDFADACAVVEEFPTAIAVGINCSPLAVVTPTLSALDGGMPFVVYPNAGQQWNAQAMAWDGEPEFASHDHLTEWVTLGAVIVGGCCGYGAHEIAGCARAIRA